MPHTSSLDTTDRRLLALLQANARESTAMLARKLGLARTTVVARIARLERDRVIAGYGVRLGSEMESATVRAFCSLSVQTRSNTQVVKALSQLPEVEEVSAVSGQFDYMVLLRCGSNEQLDALLDQIGQIDGVDDTQTSVVLSRPRPRRSAVDAPRHLP